MKCQATSRKLRDQGKSISYIRIARVIGRTLRSFHTRRYKANSKENRKGASKEFARIRSS